ncbi:MAG: hypothetical protein KBE09_01510 [Candidatus Pacebacteria bacterium]|nr:hypothetical protein [Candidatus Paceibacterota bacterium]
MSCKACGQNHAKGRCPPKRDNRAARKRAERAQEAASNNVPMRGMPVSGTGKTSASAKSDA